MRILIYFVILISQKIMANIQNCTTRQELIQFDSYKFNGHLFSHKNQTVNILKCKKMQSILNIIEINQNKIDQVIDLDFKSLSNFTFNMNQFEIDLNYYSPNLETFILRNIKKFQIEKLFFIKKSKAVLEIDKIILLNVNLQFYFENNPLQEVNPEISLEFLQPGDFYIEIKNFYFTNSVFYPEKLSPIILNGYFIQNLYFYELNFSNSPKFSDHLEFANSI